MTDNYTLRNVSRALPETLKQYLEAQYHIWNEYRVGERRRLLDSPGVIYQPPYIEATPSHVAGKPYDQLGLPDEVRAVLTAAAPNGHTGVPAIPYAHQDVERIKAAMASRPLTENAGEDRTISKHSNIPRQVATV
jgi:hypothetical protein